MPSPASTPPSFSAARRWGICLSVLISIVAAFALVAMANYLGVRYYTRFHWTGAESYRLSPMTLRVLESRTNDVKIIVFFDRQQHLYHSVSELLKEYQLANPKRIVVEYIDYLRNPGAGERIKQKFKFSQATDYNVVIFECNGKARVIYQKELSEYDLGSLLKGAKEVRRTGFKGEQLFTSAIVSITEARTPNAWFLQGHSEHDPGGDQEGWGYSTLATMLRQNQVLLHRLNLAGTNEVPANCDLLIIAGPRGTLGEKELEKIEKFLAQGGRMLAAFTSLSISKTKPGLEKLLARWGVDVGDDFVFDLPNSLNNGQNLISTNFTSHPIARPLLGSRVYFYAPPRSVDKLPNSRPAADAPKIDALILTGDRGEARTEFQNEVAIARSRDRHGAIPVAVAVEKGAIQGIDTQRGTTRMVILGDSLFLGNGVIDQFGNRDFTQLAVNWLLDRSQLMGGIGPRPLKEYTLTMTRSQMAATRWTLLAGLPGGILLLGLLVWWRRRH